MEPLTLATWNVNSIKVRAPHVQEWLQEHRPGVLGLQELKLPTPETEASEFAAAASAQGYRLEAHGQKTCNGVALLSRLPLDNVTRGLPESIEDPQARVISASLLWEPMDQVVLINVYVPNGESVTSDKYVYKLGWLEALARHVESHFRPDQPLVIMGDFNIAPEDRDVHDPAAFAGQVLFSEPEHAALKRLTDWGLVDLFRRFHPQDRLYSWWDYRMNAFRRNLGARIDLLLVTSPLADRAVACEIDVAPRKRERPSDHAPVVAEFR